MKSDGSEDGSGEGGSAQGGSAQGGSAQGGNSQGGVGTSGTGLGAQGGIASAPSCVETDRGVGTDPKGYGTPGTATGANGTFTDTCNGVGQLIEYTCNNNMICSQAGCSWDSNAYGDPVECPYGCADNACPTWCPMADDTFEVLGVTMGDVTMRHRDGQEISCLLEMAYEPDFDCVASSIVGRTFVATGAGDCRPVFGLQVYDSVLGMPFTGQCYFLCVLLP
jgi:hypothetical protein